ncbi:hypothetical protein Nmel_011766 [Mimus melanotis]
MGELGPDERTENTYSLRPGLQHRIPWAGNGEHREFGGRRAPGSLTGFDTPSSCDFQWGWFHLLPLLI